MRGSSVGREQQPPNRPASPAPLSQAVLGGKANPTEDDVKKILGSGARAREEAAVICACFEALLK